jgi:hypothetical protein
VRGLNQRSVLVGVAVTTALAAGYVTASYAVPSGSAARAVPLTDTGPPVITTPTPDPAPPAPKRTTKPRPAAKPAPRPATVYHAPPPVSPAPTTRYTPPVVHPAKTAPVQHKKHKRHRRAHPATLTPKPQGSVKAADVVHVAGVPAAVATNQTDDLKRAAVITGIGLAALLFLLVVLVPASAVRFTAPGRVVMDHQTDLIFAGLVLLVLAALFFTAIGDGS